MHEEAEIVNTFFTYSKPNFYCLFPIYVVEYDVYNANFVPEADSGSVFAAVLTKKGLFSPREAGKAPTSPNIVKQERTII